MRLKEKLIKEIDKLSSKELVEIYNLILVTKSQQNVNQESTLKQGYLKVRDALRNYRGKLSDKIIAEREEQ
jgi:hypothetical protein